MIILKIFLSLFLVVWLLWVLYVFVTGIYRAHLNKTLDPFSLIMALPIVIVAYAVDVIVNFSIAIFLFMDLPREWLTTSRLQRYLREEKGYRYDMARIICDNLLDIFDPRNKHC